MDGSKKKAESLTALIMSQISGRWPSMSHPPTDRAEPHWGSSNKLHCQQAVTDQSVTAITAQATGVIRLLPQTYSSVRLSCMLSCHRIEGREVCRGSWASPPRLPGLWGLTRNPYLCLQVPVLGGLLLWGGHCFPAPTPVNHSLDWASNLEGQHHLSISSMTPTVPVTQWRPDWKHYWAMQSTQAGWTTRHVILLPCPVTHVLYCYLTFCLFECLLSPTK